MPWVTIKTTTMRGLYDGGSARGGQKRCLNCPNLYAVWVVLVESKEIPRFTQAIARGNFGEANDILAERTNLPIICGRVCPREKSMRRQLYHR